MSPDYHKKRNRNFEEMFGEQVLLAQGILCCKWLVKQKQIERNLITINIKDMR